MSDLTFFPRGPGQPQIVVKAPLTALSSLDELTCLGCGDHLRMSPETKAKVEGWLAEGDLLVVCPRCKHPHGLLPGKGQYRIGSAVQ